MIRTCLGLILIPLAMTVHTRTVSTTVPSSIASNCSTDVTKAISNWVAKVPDGSTLNFGTNKCYKIDGTLEFTGRNGLVWNGNGSTFQTTQPPTDQRAMFRWIGSSNITMRNLRIDGSYCCGGTLNDSLQHMHGIDLRGSGMNVENVTVSDMAGDGVYFGLGYDGVTGSTGSVIGSTFQWLGRNGVSFVAAHDVTVTGTRVHRAGFDAFDVEPNVGSGPGVQRVTLDGNTITGSYRLYAYSIVMNRPVSDLAFKNTTLTGVPLKIGIVNPGAQAYRPRNVTITGNALDTPTNQPVVEVHNTDVGTITGNTAPMTSGTFATLDNSCGVTVAGNTFPGGSAEVTATNPAC